jgi:hypothetical protein
MYKQAIPTTTKTASVIALSFMTAATLHAVDAPGIDTRANGPDGAGNVYQSGTNASLEPSAVISGSNDIFVFKLAGDGQGASAGQWTPSSLEAGVWDKNGIRPLINVPVDFSLVGGGGWLARTPGAEAGTNVQILTDIDGIAQVWHRQPDQVNVQSIIAASALGKSVTFTTYSLAPADGAPSVANSVTGEALASAFNSHAPETTAAPPPAKPAQRELLSALASSGKPRHASVPVS